MKKSGVHQRPFNNSTSSFIHSHNANNNAKKTTQTTSNSTRKVLSTKSIKTEFFHDFFTIFRFLEQENSQP